MLFRSDSGSDYKPRRSRRERKVIYDDDFVIDGSGSEDEVENKKGVQSRDESWGSESESDESVEQEKKKKKAPVKKAPAPRKKKPAKKAKKVKKRILDSDEEEEEEPEDTEDSDFETKSRKKRHGAKGDVARTTRGVGLKYDDEDARYSDDD